LKYWPIETNGQPAVWAALELREKARIDELKEIEVFTSKFTWFEIGSEPEKWDPQTRETADHSLPYIFARTFVDGPIKIRSFDDEAVRDPGLRPLMSRIKVIPDDRIEALLPQQTFMRVVATTLDGRRRVVEISNPLGHRTTRCKTVTSKKNFLPWSSPRWAITLRRGPGHLVASRGNYRSECCNAVAGD
jgi:2-methylcitrate dehydratase